MELSQGKEVKGREVVSIVPQAEIKMVVKDTPPASGASKVQVLRGNDYLRVWINRGGTHYLMHFPVAGPPRRGAGDEVSGRSSKRQVPRSKALPTPKFQVVQWKLELPWSLELGPWDLIASV